MINNYENVYILKGSLTEEQALKEIEIIKEYFKDTEIFYAENKGKRKLAYNIGKETTGYWYITNFKATKEEGIKIEEKLKSNENVMKFITVKLEG